MSFLRINIFFFCLISASLLKAQDIVPHFMDKHPQTALTRVSFFPDYDFTGTIPFLGHNKINLVTNFSFNTLVSEINNGTAVFDIDNALNEMDDINFIYGENLINIISSTWRRNDLYFTFNMAHRLDFDLRLPTDLLELGWKGNAEFIEQPAILSGLGLDLIQYNEIGLGLSQNIQDKVNIGGRLKLLQGHINLNTYKSEIELQTDSISYNLKGTADISMLASGPLDTNGWVVYSYNDYFFNFNNLGVGFDIGASTKIADKLFLSADLIDIGRIKWKDKVKQLNINQASLEFKGFTIDSAFNFIPSDSTIDALLDTAKTIFGPQRINDPYRSYISPKLYLMASFDINKKNRLGMVYYNRFNKHYNYSSLSFMYRKWFGDVVSLTAKYSIVNNQYHKFGAGIMFWVQGLNFYFISEDLTTVFNPMNGQNFNFSFGMNIIRYEEDNDKNIKLD